MHERCSKGRGRILEHGNNPPLRRAGARAAASLVLALSALALSGCAVQQTGPRGKMSIGLDNAALLGTDHAKFKLGDDSEGTLRSLNGVYSLKLERFFRVISLGKRKDVQLERAVQIGDRTVLVLNQLDERNCIKTAVLAIRGDRAPDLRRRGQRVDDLPHLPPGFTAWRVPFVQDRDFVAEVCGHGPAVLVWEPLELRRQVVARLTAIAEAGR